MSKLRKKRTPPYGKALIPDVPPVREPMDSSPTPVIEMGYRDLSARLALLASRFKSQGFVFEKHPLKLDLKKSRSCYSCASNLTNLVDRIEQWPLLSKEGLAAEKSYVSEQYLTYMEIAQTLLGEGKIL